MPHNMLDHDLKIVQLETEIRVLKRLHPGGHAQKGRARGHAEKAPHAVGEPDHPRVSKAQRDLLSFKAIEDCLLCLEHDVKFISPPYQADFQKHLSSIKGIRADRDKYTADALVNKGLKASNRKLVEEYQMQKEVLKGLLNETQKNDLREQMIHKERELEEKKLKEARALEVKPLEVHGVPQNDASEVGMMDIMREL